MDNFVDFFVNRLRFIFSIECAFTVLIYFFLNKIPTIHNWVNQSYNWEYLRFLIVFLLTVVITYGAGEVVRRKLKLASILFDNSKGKHE